MTRGPHLRSKKQSCDITRDRYNVRSTAVNSGQVRFRSPSSLFALETMALI